MYYYLQFFLFFTHCDVTAAMLVVKKNKSINFSSLGTKLYFHVNSLRKNYILTFNKATFSRGCKPRITSYLPVILLVQFDLLPRHHRHTPGICSFFCSWWSTPHPRVSRKRQSPHPRAPDQPYICVLGVHLFQSKIDFHQFFKLYLLSLICMIHIKLALSYLLLVCA